jgi:glycosyltransferase involved in cell wall biosynthesis
MKVSFCTKPLFSGHKFRGIGAYTENLASNLKVVNNLNLQEFQSINEISSTDIVHFPFFDLFLRTLTLSKEFPTVVTILDVIPLIFPRNYPPGVKGRINLFFQMQSLKKVDAVITISEASKKDISKHLKFPEEKIFVTYLASSNSYKVTENKAELESIKKKFALPEKFVLFGGNNNFNKNLLNSIQACLELDLNVVLRGEGFKKTQNLDHPELRDFKEFVQKYSNNQKVHILGYISDKESNGLYNLASAMLMSSFYEGFGIPILEAQATGLPVITSNISSMPEVGGEEGAIYVDPYSLEDIKRGIKLVFEDKKLRENMVKKGFENLKRFSWHKTAQETVKVYEKVIS